MVILLLGLIPARAGNTARAAEIGKLTRAHPRSRGEHKRGGGVGLKQWGSSPLARGTRAGDNILDAVDGLIPARAGNTVPLCCRSACRRAHPRSRGEHMYRAFGRGAFFGSSPLARGTLRERQEARLAGGLIPARAGNTGFPFQLGAWEGAHPRSRGEHDDVFDAVRAVRGSSPLARGTQQVI